MNEKQNRTEFDEILYGCIELSAIYEESKEASVKLSVEAAKEDLWKFIQKQNNKARIQEMEGLEVYIYGKGQWETEDIVRDRLDILNDLNKEPEYNLFMDGDMWCATHLDFVNLQESEAGFGKTKAEAIKELIK